MSEEFFDEQLPCSKIKSTIVSSYFLAWSRIIRKTATKIGYLDFYAGPGKYEDNSDSTPLIILKSALKDEYLKKSLVTVFNDKEEANTQKLKENIDSLTNIKELKFQPDINNSTLDIDFGTSIKKINFIPSLIFIDPFGYKGLSKALIASVIKDWGCDCIFFFNYNRINAAITNRSFTEHVNALFGKETADELRMKVQGLKPNTREKLVMDTFLKSLQSIKGQYSIPFKFYMEGGSKTSHFLILVTKHVLGYNLMKDIMASNSEKEQGVASFEFNPSKRVDIQQVSLFGDSIGPLVDLCNHLLETYKGKTISMNDIFLTNNLGKPYIASNYKAALLKLEDEGKIETNPERSKRKLYKGAPTMGDNVMITFK